MHAWAEVNHDLVYKPTQGLLSDDEYAILDELNGLVLSGDIALERLQRAGETRVAEKGRLFPNHYDLAAFLLKQVADTLKNPDPERLLGRVNLLFQLLIATNKATPDALKPYLDSLTADFERRPLADQIIDMMLAESPERYKTYSGIRDRESGELRSAQLAPDIKQTHAAIGRFLTSWIKFEQELRKVDAPKYASAAFTIPIGVLVRSSQVFDSETIAQIESIRRFRNMLVHGIEIPSVADIDDATARLDAILYDLSAKRRSLQRQQTQRKGASQKRKPRKR